MIDRMSLFGAFQAIEDERAHGRGTRVLVPIDLLSLGEAQLRWLESELRRRRANSDGLVIEFDAEALLAQPELAAVIDRMREHGVLVSISDASGGLGRIGSCSNCGPTCCDCRYRRSRRWRPLISSCCCRPGWRVVAR